MEVKCLQCPKTFTPARPWQKFCRPDCCKAYHKERYHRAKEILAQETARAFFEKPI